MNFHRLADVNGSSQVIDSSFIQLGSSLFVEILNPVLFRALKNFVAGLQERGEYQDFFINIVRDSEKSKEKSGIISTLKSGAVETAAEIAFKNFLPAASLMQRLGEIESLIDEQTFLPIFRYLSQQTDSADLIKQLLAKAVEIAFDELKENPKEKPDAIIRKIVNHSDFKQITGQLVTTLQQDKKLLAMMNEITEQLINKVFVKNSYLATIMLGVTKKFYNKLSSNSKLANHMNEKLNAKLDKLAVSSQSQDEHSSRQLPRSEDANSQVFQGVAVLKEKVSENYALKSSRKQKIENAFEILVENILDADKVSVLLCHFFDRFLEGKYDEKLQVLLDLAGGGRFFSADKKLLLAKKILGDPEIYQIVVENISLLVKELRHHIRDFFDKEVIDATQVINFMSVLEIAVGQKIAKEGNSSYATDSLTFSSAEMFKENLTDILHNSDTRNLLASVVFSNSISLIANKKQEIKSIVSSIIDVVSESIREGKFDNELISALKSDKFPLLSDQKKLSLIKGFLGRKFLKTSANSILDSVIGELLLLDSGAVSRSGSLTNFLAKKIVAKVNPVGKIDSLKRKLQEKSVKLAGTPLERFVESLQEFNSKLQEAINNNLDDDVVKDDLKTHFQDLHENAELSFQFNNERIQRLEKQCQQFESQQDSVDQNQIDRINGFLHKLKQNDVFEDDEIDEIVSLLSLDNIDQWYFFLKREIAPLTLMDHLSYFIPSLAEEEPLVSKEHLSLRLSQLVTQLSEQKRIFQQHQEQHSQIRNQIEKLKEINQESLYIIDNKDAIKNSISELDLKDYKKIHARLTNSQKTLESYIAKQAKFLNYARHRDNPMYQFSMAEKLLFALKLRFSSAERKEQKLQTAMELYQYVITAISANEKFAKNPDSSFDDALAMEKSRRESLTDLKEVSAVIGKHGFFSQSDLNKTASRLHKDIEESHLSAPAA